jgi:hypothetical protein
VRPTLPEPQHLIGGRVPHHASTGHTPPTITPDLRSHHAESSFC